jgi:hypothetical protein
MIGHYSFTQSGGPIQNYFLSSAFEATLTRNRTFSHTSYLPTRLRVLFFWPDCGSFPFIHSPHLLGARCSTPHNELCLVLVSLVFLHTFCDLAQFCRKPCNPVFVVLQFLKKLKNILLFFNAKWSRPMVRVQAQELNPWTSPSGNVVLTTGIPPGREERCSFF